MRDDRPKRLPAAFYRSANGTEPVRDWLKALPPDDRRILGCDIAAAEFAWPIGGADLIASVCPEAALCIARHFFRCDEFADARVLSGCREDPRLASFEMQHLNPLGAVTSVRNQERMRQHSAITIGAWACERQRYTAALQECGERLAAVLLRQPATPRGSAGSG